jgi:hypothetical protein
MKDRHRDEGADGGEHADQQVAEHVAGDRALHAVGDVTEPLPRTPKRLDDRPPGARALDEQHHGDGRDRHHRDHDRRRAREHGDEQARPGDQIEETPGRDGADAALDVEPPIKEPERPARLEQVVREMRQATEQVAGLSDERHRDRYQ